LVVLWVVCVVCGCDVVVVVLLCDCGAIVLSCDVVVVVDWVWAIADSDRASANVAPVTSDPIFLNAMLFSPCSQRDSHFLTATRRWDAALPASDVCAMASHSGGRADDSRKCRENQEIGDETSCPTKPLHLA